MGKFVLIRRKGLFKMLNVGCRSRLIKPYYTDGEREASADDGEDNLPLSSEVQRHFPTARIQLVSCKETAV